MKYEAMPIIRLQIENMTNTICSHMGIEGSELEEMVKQKIKQFNIEKKIEDVVREELNNAIRKACQEYFTWGEGNEMVLNSINKALSSKRTTK